MTAKKIVLEEIPPVFREALAVHAIYMAAGISPDDIYVVGDAATSGGVRGQLGVQAILRASGDKIFLVTVGPLGMSEEVFRTVWPRWVAVWNGLSPDQKKRLTDGAAIREQAMEIFAGLALKRTIG